MRRLIAIALLSAMTLSASGASNKDVRKWTRKWQHKLGLADWAIDARLAKASEIRPETLGQTDWTPHSRIALLRVLRAEDYDRYSIDVRRDQELTVVHELVHIRLHELNVYTDPDMEEVFVVTISEAIFGKRAERKDQ